MVVDLDEPEDRSIKKGKYCRFFQRNYLIVDLIPGTNPEIVLEDVETHEQVNTTLADFIAKAPQVRDTEEEFRESEAPKAESSEEKNEFPDLFNPETIPQRLLDRAEHIIEIVATINEKLKQSKEIFRMKTELRKGRKTRGAWSKTESTKEACREVGIARSTYYKYQELLETHNGNHYALAQELHRETYGSRKISKAASYLCYALYNEYPGHTGESLMDIGKALLNYTQGLWLDPKRLPVEMPDKDRTKLLQKWAERLMRKQLRMDQIMEDPEVKHLFVPVKMPSRSWFMVQIRKYKYQPGRSEKEVLSREGKEFLNNDWLVFDQYVHKAQLPLEYVFVDHYLLDLFIVSEDGTQKKPFRMWLTMFIDAFSRSILGFNLSEKGSTTKDLQTALKNAIFPKGDILQKYGISTDRWPVYGIPKRLSLDNAFSHHSNSLKQLAAMISCKGNYTTVELDFRPCYKARYGAVIETVFGKIKQQLQPMAGAIDLRKRELSESLKKANRTYNDLYKRIVQLIDQHQNSPHTALDGLTPNEKWWQGTSHSLQLIPAQTPEIERMFWVIFPQTRTITQKGIQLFGSSYTSPKMRKLPRIDNSGGIIKYGIHFDPNDISQIALFIDGKYLCDAVRKEDKLPDESHTQASRLEHNLSKRIKGMKLQDKETIEREWEMANEDNALNKKRKRKTTSQSKEGTSKPPNPPKKSKKAQNPDAMESINPTVSRLKNYLQQIVEED